MGFLSDVFTGDIILSPLKLHRNFGLVLIAVIKRPASICNHSKRVFYAYFRYKSVNAHSRRRKLSDRNVGESFPLLSLTLLGI